MLKAIKKKQAKKHIVQNSQIIIIIGIIVFTQIIVKKVEKKGCSRVEDKADDVSVSYPATN